MLVALAVLGCWLGRWSGPIVRLCPYRLSAQTAAALPIGAGLFSQQADLGVTSLVVGLGAAVGTFSSGHNSRMRAVLCAGLGAAVGACVGRCCV